MSEDAGFDFDFSEVDPEPVSENVVSTSRSRPASATGARRGRRPVKRLTDLQKRLSGEMFQTGTLLGFGAPVTGYFICQESDTFTKAVVELASKRPEWLDALEHVADIGPGITIGRTFLGIGVALGVDRERVDPEKGIAKLLGVTAAYYKCYPDEMEPLTNAYKPPPSGPFVPVS